MRRRQRESFGDTLRRFERSHLVWTVEYEPATDRYAINCLNSLTGRSQWYVAPGIWWFTPGFFSYHMELLQNQVCRSWMHVY